MKQGWEYKKLGDLTTTINGLWTGKKPPFINVAVVRNTNFTKDCKLDMTNVAYLDVEEKQFQSRKLQYGDIIIEKSGGSDKQPVGRPVLFNIEDGNYSFSNFTSTLRINDRNEISPVFLHYSLLGAYLRGVTHKMQAKTTGIHNLDFKAYLKINIPIPSINIQQQIVSELDLLSGAIEKQKAQLEELDKLAQSIFYDMFGDPVTNEKGWKVKKVIDVVKLQRGFDLPVQDRDQNGEIPVYGANGIVGYHSEAKVKFGIVTGRSGSIGEVYMSNSPFWPLNTSLFSVDTHNNNLVYLMFLIKNFNLQRFKMGAGVPTLNRNSFHQNTIIDIPLALQQEFAAKIEAIESMKAKVRQSLSEAEMLFNSRMDYYFN